MDQEKPKGMLPKGSHVSADIVFAGPSCSAMKQKVSLVNIISQVPGTQESLPKDVWGPNKEPHVSLVLSSLCPVYYKVSEI